MILFFLALVVIAASVESRSEAWSAFLGFVILVSLALAFVIAIVGVL